MTPQRHDTTTEPTTAVRHDATTNDTLLRQHTIASIALESRATKRTVQRWLAKAIEHEQGDIGIIKADTRYFSEAERDILLSYQAKSKQTEETIEAELVEPGAIELHTSAATQAAPLMKFDIQAIALNVPGSDLSALQQQTAQLEQVVNQGANAVAFALAARFQNGVAEIVAEQDNLLQGIRAQALSGAAQSVSNQGANND